jgi:hypothetical protein
MQCAEAMPRPGLVLLLLLVLSSVNAPADARELDERPRRVGPYSASRYDRLRSARVTPGSTTPAMIARQAGEQYNAIVLNDCIEWDFEHQRWVRPDEQAIAAQLALARRYGMSVILMLPAVVPIPKYLPAARTAQQPAQRRPFRPLALAETQPSAVEYTLSYLANDELRARLELWTRYDRGEIVGVVFMPDDVFLLDIPSAVQQEWFTIAREIAPAVPVLAIAGEFALSAGARRDAWAPSSFDHLLWLNYPYNLAWVWGRTLDHHASADPDGDLARYEAEYAASMHERWFRDLRPQQLIIPVIQTFFYSTEPRGSIPRDTDVELQCRIVQDVIRETFGQHDNFAIGYFYAGGGEANDPFPHPHGIYDVPSWPAIIDANNARLEQLRRAAH